MPPVHEMIQLVEGLKQPAAGALRNADPCIRHGEFKRYPSLSSCQYPQRHLDPASVGELHGISHQIEQNLLQSFTIADQLLRHIRTDADLNLQALFISFVLQQLKHRIHTGHKHKRLFMKNCFSGLNFGKVQHIVDDRKQGIPALTNDIQILSLQ
ncbi:hypothetical protein D3C74_340890 [compost metagenome]